MTDHRALTRREAEAALVPAPKSRVKKAVAMLLGCYPDTGKIGDPRVYTRAMIEALARYPEDVLNAVIEDAIKKFKWPPPVAEMIELAEELMKPRRRKLRLAVTREKGIRSERDYFQTLADMRAERGSTEKDSTALAMEIMNLVARGNEQTTLALPKPEADDRDEKDETEK